MCRSGQGRRRQVDLREVLNAVFYLLECQWRALPRNLLPRSTVHDYFHPLAVRPNAFEAASRALRAGPGAGQQGGEPDHRDHRQPEGQERGKEGRTPDPVGYDAGKKIKGRKRHAVVDIGLMLGLAIPQTAREFSAQRHGNDGLVGR